jgi:carbon storage regulator
MLVLTRRPGQALMIGEVEVYVVEVKGDQVRLSIDAPRHIPIIRSEVLKAVQQENAAAAAAGPDLLDELASLSPPAETDVTDPSQENP